MLFHERTLNMLQIIIYWDLEKIFKNMYYLKINLEKDNMSLCVNMKLSYVCIKNI